VAIKAFAKSMIGIFIPAYLWGLGFSIRGIAFFYIVYFFFVAVFVPFCFKAAAKWGIKHNMIAGLLISLVYIYLLYLVKYGFPFWIAAVIGALYVAYYWSGFHADFARFTVKKETGKELGSIRFLSEMFSLAGPLAGALILTRFNFTVLMFIVGFFILLSILPLLISRDRYAPYRFRFRDIFSERNTKYILSFEATGIINVVAEMAWPLFIFISLHTYISLGAIVTVTSVLVAFLTLYIGQLADYLKTSKIVVAGSTFHSLLWIIRYFVSAAYSIFFVNLGSSISYMMFDLPYNKFVYHRAIKEKNQTEFFIMREWSMVVGRMVVLLFILFTESLFSGFVIAAFASLLFLMFRK
jgi:MFS family permease